MWSQGYDPLGNAVLSTLLAGTPVIVLLGTIGWLRWKAHHAALTGLATALVIALFVFRLPPLMAVSAAIYGAAYGFFPIGWIVLNVIFLYQFTNYYLDFLSSTRSCRISCKYGRSRWPVYLAGNLMSLISAYLTIPPALRSS